ncbi:MAG: hypothetical protein ACI9IP_000474 [Arcticibacterium sp.]|jgi:hypothetical protein
MNEEDNIFTDTTEPFKGAGKVKKQIVSEIDSIRDTMVMVNMFMGEPFRIVSVMLEEYQSNKDNE